MFDELRICALGSVDEAVLELHAGLTVLSGETGAGKSSIVRAFGLLAGGRADASQVRSGRASAAVEGRLTVDPESVIASRVREVGGELEGSCLIVARTVSSRNGLVIKKAGSCPPPVSSFCGKPVTNMTGTAPSRRISSTASIPELPSASCTSDKINVG